VSFGTAKQGFNEHFAPREYFLEGEEVDVAGPAVVGGTEGFSPRELDEYVAATPDAVGHVPAGATQRWKLTRMGNAWMRSTWRRVEVTP
jgi:hypothetical protein